jgi:hypothetical protein
METSHYDESKKIFEQCRDKFLKSLDDNSALDKAAKVLLEEIKATEIKAFSSNGEVIYSKRMKAHSPRLKAIELLISLYGLKAPEKHEVTVIKPMVILDGQEGNE